MSSQVKLLLQQVSRSLTEATNALKQSKVVDPLLNVKEFTKLQSRCSEIVDIVTKNETLFLKDQLDLSKDNPRFKLRIQIKLLSLEQISDKKLLKLAKTDDEKRLYQSRISMRSSRLTFFHKELIKIKIKNENTK